MKTNYYENVKIFEQASKAISEVAMDALATASGSRVSAAEYTDRARGETEEERARSYSGYARMVDYAARAAVYDVIASVLVTDVLPKVLKELSVWKLPKVESEAGENA